MKNIGKSVVMHVAASIILAVHPQAAFSQQASCQPLQCYEQALAKLQAAEDALTQTRNTLEQEFKHQVTIPIGAIVSWSGQIETIPSGWLLCDGHRINQSEYPDLVRILQENWGGDGTTYAFLPDLRGVFLRGVDRDANGNTSNRDPESAQRGYSRTGDDSGQRGNKGNDVGSYQTASTALPKNRFQTNDAGLHHHFVPTFNGVGGGSHEVGTGYWTGYDYVPQEPTTDDGNHHHTVTQGGDHETRPANVAVFWIIKATQ